MRTSVCITVDTEFSIGGVFTNSQLHPIAEEVVWCNVNGQSEGLGFMLSCFKEYGVGATFFIETVHRHYFNKDPMRPIALQIAEAGHEVQLHAHPCWSVFKNKDWQSRVQQTNPDDRFYRRSIESSRELIEQGVSTFKDWGIPAPDVFRSGNLHHDDALYMALSAAGIPFSSNIGYSIFNCSDPHYELYSGAHQRHGLLEMPILTYSDWSLPNRPHFKSLTITGASSWETQYLLEQAHSTGIPLVVILTHPFEFVQSKDNRYTVTKRHCVNQARLRKLCRFLHLNRDRFSATGMAKAARRIRPEETGTNHLLKGAVWHSIGRMITQVCYDKYGQCALAKAN